MRRFKPLRATPSLSDPQLSDSSDTNSSAENTENAPPNDEPAPFYPSLFDVLKVRYLLQWKIFKEAMPPEIVDLIVDAAEYWASREVRVGEKQVVRSDGDREMLRTGALCFETPESKPLPHRTLHPCRKIEFSIASHDQGWGGGVEGSYKTSYTWFDAYLVRGAQSPNADMVDSREDPGEPGPRSFGSDDAHLLPTGEKLQSNPTAVGTTQQYHITWHYLDGTAPRTPEAEEIEQTQGRGQGTLDGRRVRQMGVGDSISIWGRARFGGWSNHVESVGVRLFWAV